MIHKKGFVTASFWFFVMGTSAIAQTSRSAGPLQIGLADWTLTPILADGQVEGFLALRDLGQETGENLTSVWFQKEPDDTWTTWAWDNQARAGAIAWLKQTKSIEGESDSLWPVTGYDDITSPSAPSQTRNGVFLADPFSSALEAMSEAERQVLLDALIEAGWRASKIDTELAGPVDECLRGQILPAIENGIEAFVNDAVAAEAVAHSELETLACISICLYWWWNGPVTCGPWTCGAWAPDPVTPGPIPNGPCRDICHYLRSATRTCTRTQTVRHWDCTKTTTTQTRTDTGTQTGRCDVDLSSVGCVHGAAPCPAGPCNPGSGTCAPNPVSINFGSWN